MNNKEIAEIQLEEILSVWRLINEFYNDKEISKRMYKLENDKINLTYIRGYQDALMDIQKCIEPDIETLDEEIKKFKNKSII